MSGDRSCYVLEWFTGGQEAATLFFAYRKREHIRRLVHNVFVDSDDPETSAMYIDQLADDGGALDLWVIEHGRQAGHVDLRPIFQPTDAEDGPAPVDWVYFDASVPAGLAGEHLRPGETLHLRAVRQDFGRTDSELPTLYPDQPIQYGMQVLVNGELSDQPHQVYSDPDPESAAVRQAQ